MINVNPFDELASLIREVKEKQDQLDARLSHIGQPDELVTRHEKAEQLKVSLPTLRNWEIQGIIKPIRIGRRVYFRKGTDHPKSNSTL